MVDFRKFNIEELLAERNIEFRNPSKAPGGWLPLDVYDNKEMDTRAPKDWMVVKKPDADKSADDASASEPRAKRAVKTEIPAQGLWQDRDGLCFWRRLKITKYLVKSEKYVGYWENTKESVKLPRIFILFDDEDPREFAKRFEDAYTTRTMADSLLKYNFYIENMPTHQIPEIETDKVNRVLSMT
jgi:dynein heavy chain